MLDPSSIRPFLISFDLYRWDLDWEIVVREFLGLSGVPTVLLLLICKAEVGAVGDVVVHVRVPWEAT